MCFNFFLFLFCELLVGLLQNILSNEYDFNKYDHEPINSNMESKKLYAWFTSNNHILSLMEIAHALNRYLYSEDSCKLNLAYVNLYITH